jgi:hypothetical protein
VLSFLRCSCLFFGGLCLEGRSWRTNWRRIIILHHRPHRISIWNSSTRENTWTGLSSISLSFRPDSKIRITTKGSRGGKVK